MIWPSRMATGSEGARSSQTQVAKPTEGMTMVTQTRDTQRFAEKVRQIKAGVPAILAQWGLRSEFSRWRLTQDPSTGLVVLFGVLNNKYTAAHPSHAFSDYFDPRVLLDLAIDLNIAVVPSDSEGLRYAFILDRGQLGPLPARVDLPSLERSQLFVGRPDTNEPLARAWDKPMVVVDVTNRDQPNERNEDYQALADFQRTLIDAQAIPAPLIKPLPALITPNHGLASVVAIPTVLAQVEAEVERRKVFYEPRPRTQKNLNAPSPAPLAKSGAPPMLPMLLMTEQGPSRIHEEEE